MSYLGVVVENGVATLKGIFTEKVVTNEIELVDKATGEKYCTWIENGEWIKKKGECSSLENSQEPVATEQPVTQPLVRHYCDEGYAEECTNPDGCRAAGLYWYEADCWAEPNPNAPGPVLEAETSSTEEAFVPVVEEMLQTESSATSDV